MIKTLTGRNVAFLLVGASIVAMGMSVWTQVEQHEAELDRAAYEKCVDDTVSALVVSLRDTRQVAADERTTTRALYRDIAERPREFRDRLEGYLAQLDEADRKRAANPLPEPPNIACRKTRD